MAALSRRHRRLLVIREDDYYRGARRGERGACGRSVSRVDGASAAAVDVALEDVRSGLSWKGENIALPDVREVIARMKSPLSTFGGVEFAVYTSEDQLTLNPHLELFIYARTDQWFYILQGKGLEERRMLRTRSWRLKRNEFAPAPDLVQAVGAAAERLALTAA